MNNDQRLSLIKEVAEKFNKRKAFRAKMAKGAAMVRKWTDEEEKVSRKKQFDLISKYDENHNHYTDAPKYLDEHYGDRARDQEAYEKDWN